MINNMMIRELNNAFVNNLRYDARFERFIAFDVYCGGIEDASSISLRVISPENAIFDTGDAISVVEVAICSKVCIGSGESFFCVSRNGFFSDISSAEHA